MKTLKHLLLAVFLLSASMAEATTFYGTNATSTQNSNPLSKVRAREDSGRLRVKYDEYTVTSAGFTGLDVINLMKLPKGAKVYEVRASTPRLGEATECQLFIGVTANGSGVQTANTQLFTGSSGAECGGADLEFTMAGDQTIAGNGTTLLEETLVTLSTSQSLNVNTARDQKIKVWVWYSVD